MGVVCVLVYHGSSRCNDEDAANLDEKEKKRLDTCAREVTKQYSIHVAADLIHVNPFKHRSTLRDGLLEQFFKHGLLSEALERDLQHTARMEFRVAAAGADERRLEAF